MATSRWRLDLAYDGAAFAGFAVQPDRTTVVGDLRAAIARSLQLDDEPFLVGAGRTDAGVHAFAQVVSFDLPEAALDDALLERFTRSLNAQLRGRVLVTRALRVPDDFSARHDALWRSYRYLVAPSPSLVALESIAWSVGGEIDLAAMNEASALVHGEHDFRAFCKRPADKGPDEPLVRNVFEASWRVEPDALRLSPSGEPFYVFSIRAKAFCHNMVRRLVSSLVAVGQGRLRAEDITARLETHSGVGLPAPAPAAGLALTAVGYEAAHGGPAGGSTGPR
ncbi:MAG TPA: tRNA pseudouridine(38-40) synthase TruA [Acidimicrobiales bacterium]|nr:tRNA pseudouridine(38-40) synthase TruA [Acidimicrobiales bacterium]